MVFAPENAARWSGSTACWTFALRRRTTRCDLRGPVRFPWRSGKVTATPERELSPIADGWKGLQGAKELGVLQGIGSHDYLDAWSKGLRKKLQKGLT